jgi:methylthioribose-1-phosphate isomerase
LTHCGLSELLSVTEVPYDSVRAVEWRNGRLWLLDQRRLPAQEAHVVLSQARAVAEAIRDMVVRGAPAIGITAAYGVVLAVRARYEADPGNWKGALQEDLALLAAARPTAVNLSWALERMRRRMATIAGDPLPEVLDEARRIHAEDIAANRQMGALGAQLIVAGSNVLTHCNTGSLATGGYGTALGVIRSAYGAGKIRRIYADETRPWLQGARLTAWELLREGIPVTLIADGAAAYLLAQGDVGWVIVGADRIAANGDVANKIGTYALAIAARHHGVRFMVVAPSSTIDASLSSGRDIPIEIRPQDEILSLSDRPVAAPGADAWNPAFDVTPAALVDAIVTERGVVLAPEPGKMSSLLEGAGGSLQGSLATP